MKNMTFSKVKAKQKVLNLAFYDNGGHLFYNAFTVFLKTINAAEPCKFT